MSHEFLPTNRPFTIYHAGIGTFTKEQIDNNDFKIDKFVDKIANCGVVFLKDKGQEIWQIVVPKLAADFRRGVKKFTREIEKGTNKKLMTNFFETADKINLKNF